MATSPSKQALRDKRRAAGLCIHCGDPALPAAPGSPHPTMTYCARHRKAHAESYARSIAISEANGICRNIGCSNPTEGGKKHCSKCNRKTTNQTARRRELRIAAGLCGNCGQRPRLPDHTRCRPCLDDETAVLNVLRDKRRASGLCGRCGERPIGTGRNKLCDDCARTGRAYHASRKMACLDAYGGPVCVGCGETEIVVLQLDHIGGGGHQHALFLGEGNHTRGRAKLYTWLISQDFPPGYRILCANCNIRAARGVPFPRPAEAS